MDTWKYVQYECKFGVLFGVSSSICGLISVRGFTSNMLKVSLSFAERILSTSPLVRKVFVECFLHVVARLVWDKFLFLLLNTLWKRSKSFCLPHCQFFSIANGLPGIECKLPRWEGSVWLSYGTRVEKLLLFIFIYLFISLLIKTVPVMLLRMGM
jgi:hypothetical protein